MPRQCSACAEVLEKENFSSRQWNLRAKTRRCQTCISTGRVSSCTATANTTTPPALIDITSSCNIPEATKPTSKSAKSSRPAIVPLIFMKTSGECIKRKTMISDTSLLIEALVSLIKSAVDPRMPSHTPVPTNVILVSKDIKIRRVLTGTYTPSVFSLSADSPADVGDISQVVADGGALVVTFTGPFLHLTPLCHGMSNIDLMLHQYKLKPSAHKWDSFDALRFRIPATVYRFAVHCRLGVVH